MVKGLTWKTLARTTTAKKRLPMNWTLINILKHTDTGFSSFQYIYTHQEIVDMTWMRSLFLRGADERDNRDILSYRCQGKTCCIDGTTSVVQYWPSHLHSLMGPSKLKAVNSWCPFFCPPGQGPTEVSSFFCEPHMISRTDENLLPVLSYTRVISHVGYERTYPYLLYTRCLLFSSIPPFSLLLEAEL